MLLRGSGTCLEGSNRGPAAVPVLQKRWHRLRTAWQCLMAEERWHRWGWHSDTRKGRSGSGEDSAE